MEKEITSVKLLDIWFNAQYFHSDEQKEEELKQLNKNLTKDLS